MCFRLPYGAGKGDIELRRKQDVFEMLQNNCSKDETLASGMRWRYFVAHPSVLLGVPQEVCRRGFLGITGTSHWLMSDCKNQILGGHGLLKEQDRHEVRCLVSA